MSDLYVAHARKRQNQTLFPWFREPHAWLCETSPLYQQWSSYPRSNAVHWTVAGLVAASFAFVAIVNPQLSGTLLASSTWTQTSQSDFNAGTASSVAVANTSGGEVTLAEATYSKRRAITIDNTNGGTVTDGLFSVELTSANFDFATTQVDGDDIRVFDTDNTTAIEYWTESWNAGSETATIWVKVPSLAAGATRTLYLHYGNASAASGSAAAFTTTPATSGLSLWLDADTLAGADGASVSTWDDARSNGTSATQATASVQPTLQTNELNGHSVVRFDGSDDYVSFNAISDIRSVFWVYKYNAAAGANYRPMLGHSSAADFHGDNGQNFWSGYTSASIRGGTTRLHGSAVDGTATQMPTSFKYVSVVTTGNVSADSLARDRSFADRVLAGDIGELLIYNTELSGTQVAAVESYLNAKYFATTSVGEALATSGTLTSAAYDTAQFSDFTTLSWSATTPTGTSVKFQLRSASSEAGLADATWYGPTGTDDFYTSSGTTTNSTHDGARWVQYRATLESTSVGATPTLESVSLAYDAASVSVTSNTSYTAATYTMNDLTIGSGATFTLAGGTTLNVLGNLTLDDAGGASKIVCEGSNTSAASGGRGCTINVTGSTTIDANSMIDADGKGYAPGSGNTNGAGPGGGTGTGSFYDAGGGAYGGNGSTQQAANPGGTSYGLSSATAPIELGSGGGGSGAGTGGAGGGAIRLTTTGTLTLNGQISADGATGSTSYDGAGAGGSLYITVGTITGSGTMSANGGSSSGGGGDGGGGRIAVYYGSNTDFDLKTDLTVAGGTGASGGVPEDGTIAVFGTSAGAGSYDLEVYERFIYPEDSTLTLRNITVGDATATGASLTVGGGSTITLSGTATVTGSSTITFQGKNTTAQVSSAWAGEGVTMSAANVSIASGSTLTATGEGYIGGVSGGADGKGPGAGGGSSGFNAAGAGYGGRGADGCSATGGSAYGYSLEPQELGSGGGAQADNAGGAGGGSIHLTISGTLTLGGTITANGEDGTGHSAGAGSGGSIFVNTSAITGAGTFSADGGGHASNNCAGAGSGGRVVVRYTTGTDYTGAASSTASLGSTGKQTNGTSGSIVFMANNSWTVSSDFQIDPDETVNLNSITVNNGATLTVGGGTSITLSGTLSLSGNSTLLAQGKNTSAQVSSAWAGEGITITANAVQVDSGSILDANGQGYIGGTSSGDGKGPGGGVGSASFNAGGAGHGGVGGDGCSASGGSSYGTASSPIALGSGGGAQDTNAGGDGGGAVRLSVTDGLTINGTIRANGEDGTGHSAGAGSGGSIYATAATVSGSGTVTANGGTHASNSCAGRGAGGRIAIIYTTSGVNTLTMTASAGADSATAGDGTVIYTSAPSVTLTTADQAVVSDEPSLQLTLDDASDKTLYARVQYMSHGDTVCSDADFTGATTVTSGTDAGWSATSFDTASGALTATYTPPVGLASGYYCWRATTRAATGTFTEYSAYTSPRSFIVDAAAPGTSTITTSFSTYYTSTSGIPSSLSGLVADDGSGQGLSANTATFTLSRASDGKYWNGSTWVSGVNYLATTHSATTGSTAATWTSNVSLPTWGEDVYTVRVRATDKASNTTDSTASAFTYDQTPPAEITDVWDGEDSVDDDYMATTEELAANWAETTDATAGLQKYEYAVGTSDGGSDILSWTNNTTNVTTTVENLELAEGTEYYVATRAVDNAGNVTSISSSDGIVPDVTGPASIASIEEEPTGTAAEAINTPTKLTIVWPATTDAISGVQKYQYALGTSAGATNVIDWTDSSAVVANAAPRPRFIESAFAATEYEEVLTGLALENGKTYYASVRAVDNVGNVSAVATSDGVTVDTSVPAAPSFTAPAADGSVYDSTPQLTGTAEANATVKVTVNGIAYTTTSSTSGTWSIEVGSPLTAGTRYSATATATDAAGNISATASRSFTYLTIASACLDCGTDMTTDEVLAFAPSSPKKVESVPVDEQRESARVALKVRGVTFGLDQGLAAELYRGDDATVIVTPPSGKTTRSVRIDLMGAQYELELQPDGTYRRTLAAAEIGETSVGIITLQYTDGTSEQLTISLLIDPYGYVYALDDQGREVRLSNAEVLLEQQTPAGWQSWDAARYGQVNPQQTNQQGEYAFVVPTGVYRLTVTHPEYLRYQSAELVVIGEPINLNVQLRAPSPLGNLLTTIGAPDAAQVVADIATSPAGQALNTAAVVSVVALTVAAVAAPALAGGQAAAGSTAHLRSSSTAITAGTASATQRRRGLLAVLALLRHRHEQRWMRWIRTGLLVGGTLLATIVYFGSDDRAQGWVLVVYAGLWVAEVAHLVHQRTAHR